jgi:hypothetical protein
MNYTLRSSNDARQNVQIKKMCDCIAIVRPPLSRNTPQFPKLAASLAAAWLGMDRYTKRSRGPLLGGTQTGPSCFVHGHKLQNTSALAPSHSNYKRFRDFRKTY